MASMMIYYVLTRKRIVTAFESITTENESQKQLRILWLAWHGAGFFCFFRMYVCSFVCSNSIGRGGGHPKMRFDQANCNHNCLIGTIKMSFTHRCTSN